MFYISCKTLIENIEKHTVISFDIFDTLITRTFSSPSDIFRIMENIINKSRLNINNFFKLRKNVEKELRNNLQEGIMEEITLSDIYNLIQKKTNLPDNDIEYLYNLEITTEINNLKLNNIGYYLFNIAKKMNKKIILISDMYIERSVIENILNKNGINGYFHIYISSEHKLTKHTGHLFEFVIDNLNISAEQMLHIGDNPVGDHSVPQKLKIDTFLLRKRTDLLENNYTFGKNIFKEYKKGLTLSKSFVLKMISDGIFNSCLNNKEKVFDDNPFYFGYNILGPLAVGFSFWIKNNIEKNNINNVLFLSRDGLILKKTFDVLFGDCIPTNYIRSSRMISQICNMNNEWDLELELSKPVYSQDLHFYLKYRFGLDDNDLTDIENIKIGAKFNKEKLRDIVFSKKECIFVNSKKQQQMYREYLKNYVKDNDKVCIVDIGYAGTMQKCISNLLEKDVYGFYLSSDYAFLDKGIDIKYVDSYIDHFFIGEKKDSPYGINKFRFIYESLICSSENSFCKFMEINNTLVETFSSYEDIFRKNFVSICHKGIIQFAQDFIKLWPNSLEFVLSGKDASFIMDSFLMKPTPNDISLFYNIEFEDSQAPDKKRVLISNDNNNLIEQLWTEAVKLNNDKNISKSAETPSKNKENKYIPKQKNTSISFVKKIESIFVYLLCNHKKIKKYEKNRNLFFHDSKNIFIKKYYSIFDEV